MHIHITVHLTGRLLCPNIVHFHFTSLGTEYSLRNLLILSNKLISIPKSFHSVEPQFSHKLSSLFVVERHRCMDEDTFVYVTQKDQLLITVLF